MAASLVHALPTVELRHDLPDGSWHIDWMIAAEPGESGLLTTFRLPRPVDELCENQQLAAVRIGDHRREYLDYEGPVSGGRGSVARLRRGAAEIVRRTADCWRLRVRWEGLPPSSSPMVQELLLSAHGAKSGQWMVTCLGQDARLTSQ